jgi:hypothetical protein
MWLGYVASLVLARPRYADAEFRAFLRRYQRATLVLGKRRAIARLAHQRVRAGLVPTP